MEKAGDGADLGEDSHPPHTDMEQPWGFTLLPSECSLRVAAGERLCEAVVLSQDGVWMAPCWPAEMAWGPLRLQWSHCLVKPTVPSPQLAQQFVFHCWKTPPTKPVTPQSLQMQLPSSLP